MEEHERAGNVACKGEMRNSYKIAVGEPEGMKPSGRFSIYGRITLKCK